MSNNNETLNVESYQFDTARACTSKVVLFSKRLQSSRSASSSFYVAYQDLAEKIFLVNMTKCSMSTTLLDAPKYFIQRYNHQSIFLHHEMLE